MEQNLNSATRRELPTGELVRRLLALTWRFRAGCVQVLLLQFALLAITLSGLQLTGLGIDFIHHTIEPTARAPRWPFGLQPPPGWTPLGTLTALAGAIVGIALVRSVLNYLCSYGMVRLVQQGVVVELRSQVYNKLQRLSFRFFDANASGTLINRVAGDVQNVRSFVDAVVMQMLVLVVSLSLYLVYMLHVDVWLTLACLSPVPLMGLASLRFSRAVRPLYRESLNRMDRLILRLSECVRGIHVVKGFSREPEELALWQTDNRAVRDQNFSIFRRTSVFNPTIHVLSQLNLTILLGFGGWLYMTDRIPLGTGLVVFVGLLQRFAGQVTAISGIANSIEQSLSAARRVFEILDAPLEVSTRSGARRIPRLQGAVRFEDVGFEYEPGRPVLGGLSFDVPAGRCIGIMGHTGSGKSTLLSLIPRFYDATAGRILLDGVDVRELELDTLRRNIGLVFQQSFLFSNTVEANIAFGSPQASRPEVERAASIAAAHEFITRLPDGYQTVLREEGVNLSGGQRQRLAIARAILMNPAILILDDPTASVDAQTEGEILAAMESAMRGRTTFLVTHRISALRRADRVLVLKEGRIVQSGTHHELLTVPGPYRRAARIQIDEESQALLGGKP